MTIELGANPWILIGLMFLEILLVLIPAIIASKFENTTFKEEIVFMGFKRNKDPLRKNIVKILAGIGIGFIFLLIGGYIILFFKYLIVENLLGTVFVNQGEEGSINTSPLEPSILQIVILIVLQVLLVGVCEEAFFRGFIVKKLEIKIKSIYAILLSSICFALYHVPPFLVPISTIITYFGYYFTFGILLSAVFVLFNRSLIPCSIAHSTYNILILIL